MQRHSSDIIKIATGYYVCEINGVPVEVVRLQPVMAGRTLPSSRWFTRVNGVARDEIYISKSKAIAGVRQILGL